MDLRRYTLVERPDLEIEVDRLSEAAWPKFLLNGNTESWHLLFEIFAPYQILICNLEDELIAAGHIVPLLWDGNQADLPETIEGILTRAEQVYREGQIPNTFSALAAMVSPEQRGKGLSKILLQEMLSITRQNKCSALIAPVRPTWKSRYPLAPMERYVHWKQKDGAPFDPWIRVHSRMGAEILKVAPNTLTVEGTLAEWEEWTGMGFPETGAYVVPGALQPVKVDREQDLGHYEDPNVWMKHLP